jgi:hypothetical protein
MAAEWKKILLEGDAGTSCKVLVSANDTTEGYLGAKIVAGTSMEETLSGAGDETYTLGVIADGITAAQIADDAVGSEHIEALSDDLDFAGNEATDMAVHNVADATARNGLTPVLGKIVFQVDTLHPYICTAIA